MLLQVTRLAPGVRGRAAIIRATTGVSYGVAIVVFIINGNGKRKLELRNAGKENELLHSPLQRSFYLCRGSVAQWRNWKPKFRLTVGKSKFSPSATFANRQQDCLSASWVYQLCSVVLNFQ